MHFDNFYKKKYPINSINFNKKLNWFFDIKYIVSKKLKKKLLKIKQYNYQMIIKY